MVCMLRLYNELPKDREETQLDQRQNFFMRCAKTLNSGVLAVAVRVLPLQRTVQRSSTPVAQPAARLADRR